jgi:hypothetical protein
MGMITSLRPSRHPASLCFECLSARARHGCRARLLPSRTASTEPELPTAPCYARDRSPVAFRQGHATLTSIPSRSPPLATHGHRPRLGRYLAAVHLMMRRSAHPSSSCHTRSPVYASVCHAVMTPRATGFTVTKPPCH